MNWIDFIIVAIIVISTVASLIRGLISELLSFTVWIFAGGVGFFFYSDLAAHMQWIEIDGFRPLAAFFILFLVTMILGALLSYLLGSLFKKVGISGTDRLLGGVFGAIRGVALVVILVLIVGIMPLGSQPWWHGSKLSVHFIKVAAWVKLQLPVKIADYFPHI